MKNDITNKDDIKLLVDTFYDKVKTNSVIGHIFNDIAKVDWEHHLPKMYSFWESLLLGEKGFTGNPMQKHIELSKLTAMTETQFSEWLLIFTQTTDELFEGIKADEAKTRAANIARLMLYKIQTLSIN
ncbi:MAG: group III truncated hemoglobin [Chitinophagales bacterium]